MRGNVSSGKRKAELLKQELQCSFMDLLRIKSH